jgi:hypothetical protein
MAVKLGEKVKDTLSGFEGTATGRAEYLYGCVRVQVEGVKPDSDGKPVEVWFDEQRLTEASEAPVGGPRGAPPSRDPRR